MSVGIKTNTAKKSENTIKRFSIHAGFSKTAKILGGCGLFLLATVSAFFIFNKISSALVDPVRSVDFVSSNTSYDNYESGAWKINKSARWVARGKARITIEVNSIAKDDDRPKDILLVLDNSGSMLGTRLETAKHEINNLVSTLMTERNARFGLVTFNSTATLVQNLTDNRQTILDAIEGLGVYGQTNYYQALKKMDDVFSNYDFSAGRRPIVVLLTDGVPTVDTPLEVAEYQYFKSAYPDVSVRAVQYEMGSEIVQALKNISDKQWSTEVENFGETLWRAIAEDSYDFDEFIVTDYINSEFYEISSVNSINASVGTYALNYENGTPKVTWNMSGLYRSGTKEKLTIDIRIKDQYFDDEDGRYPTNIKTDVQSSIRDASDEQLTNNATPILKLKYLVTMNNNVPDPSCTTTVSSEKHIVFDPVNMDYETGERCGAYYTNGWDLVDEEVQRIGSDYFLMPEQDVDLRALWRKVSIEKSMEGTLNPAPTASLKTGLNINTALKNLVPNANAENQMTPDTAIAAFRRAQTLPENFDFASATKLSTDDSPFPVYAWLGTDGSTVFYWSDAESIYMNENSACMFETFGAINDLSGLADFNSSKVKNLSYFFKNSTAADLSPIKDWDVRQVTDIRGAFWDDKAIENLDDLIGWRLPNVTIVDDMLRGTSSLKSVAGARYFGMENLVYANYLLYEAKNLTSLDGLENWSTQKLKSLGSTFRGMEKLTDISALSNWNVSNVTDFSYTFGDAWLVGNLTPLQNWNVSSGLNLSGMFYNNSEITNLAAIANWRPSSATTIANMFTGNGKLVSLDGLQGWELDDVTNMSGLFNGCNVLTDISALAGWKNHLGNVKTIQAIFDGARSLSDISALSDWQMPNLTSMDSAFAWASSLADFSPLAGWNVDKVTTLRRTFHNTLVADLSFLENWNVGNVTDMSQIFYACHRIESLAPISGWDVSKVTDLGHSFRELDNITTLEPLRNWNVVSVTNMHATFGADSSISNIEPLEDWGPKLSNHLTDISWVFQAMWDLDDISPISNWDVSSVKYMEGVFNGVKLANLEAIRGWDVSAVTTFASMFHSCVHLTDVSAIANWAVQDQVNMENMFYNVPATNIPDWYEP